MDGSSPLANVALYKRHVINTLVTDELFMQIFTDDLKVDPECDEAKSAVKKFIHDCNYVDETVTEAGIYVTVLNRVAFDGGRFSSFELELLFDVTKSHSEISFAGIVGNRLDNIMWAADLALSRDTQLGIGKSSMKSRPIASPARFTSGAITYAFTDFPMERICA
jgi:hypothetical protein